MSRRYHRVPEIPEGPPCLASFRAAAAASKLEAVVDALRVEASQRPVLLACSGGADSVLLGSCLMLAGRPFEIAHINHHLRPSAHRDEAFVEALAASWEVPARVMHTRVPKERASLEDAARDARYRHLLDAARTREAVLMTAHTATDRFETVMMRLGRGTGLRGLSGIEERVERDGVVIERPLLELWRGEVRELLTAAAIPWVEDPTNAEDFALRNRVRHRMSPVFFEEFSERATLRSLRLIAEETRLYRRWIRALGADLEPTIDDGVLRVSGPSLRAFVSCSERPRVPEAHQQVRARVESWGRLEVDDPGLEDALLRAVLAELFGEARLTAAEATLREISAGVLGGYAVATASYRQRAEYTPRHGLRVETCADPSRPFPARSWSSSGSAGGSTTEGQTAPVSLRVDELPNDSAVCHGSWRVRLRRVSAAAVRTDGFDDPSVEAFDLEALPKSLVLRFLRRDDVWVGADGERRNLWKRAKRDGFDRVERARAAVLASDSEESAVVYWLLGSRRSSCALVTAATSTVLLVSAMTTVGASQTRADRSH